MIDDKKKKLIQDAMFVYGDKIKPCGISGGFENCFTIHEDKLIFWFETGDHSTHIMSSDLKPGKSDKAAN